ncbi:hypothetical protein [Acetobacter indonesiensis]
MKTGGSITIKSFERAMTWFSDNWPENQPWPDAIERPTPAREGV